MVLQYWLIGWGLLALIALAAPGVVAAGLLLLVPGLILIAAPTVFLYSAMFAVFRRVLPPGDAFLRNVGAGAAAALLGWLMAQPGSMAGRRAFDRANLPDVLPASTVRLSGLIRLELPRKSGVRKREGPRCEALCAALLDTPGVEGVTIAAPAVTFRLVERSGGDRSPGELPANPEKILAELPLEGGRDKRGVSVRLAGEKEDQQAVAAGWGLRLASREKLVMEPAGRDAAMTIRLTEERRGHDDVSISRVEIVDKQGQVLLRRAVVSGSALAVPLRFNGSGSLENFRMGLARDRLRNAPEYLELRPVTELFQHSSLARPDVRAEAITDLQERLRRAAGNAALAPGDPDLGLAALWLPTMDWRRRLSRSELHTLGRVIADERIALPDDLYGGNDSKVAPELRDALATRIRNRATPSHTRGRLAKLLSRMPEGTFRELLADEQAILQSTTLRRDAYPIIVRLADQGEAAVPGLMAILKSDMTVEPLSNRIWVMRAVALAFATLGPKARSALAEVDELVNAARSPLLHDWGDRERWYLALVRMGKPIDELHWFNNRPEMIARNRANLQRRIERFHPSEVWNY